MDNEYIGSLKIIIQSKFFIIFLGGIVVDIITGTLSAFINNNVYSKINKNGITRHIAIVLFSVFASWVFIILGHREYGQILALFYIASYGLSIIENLGKMGVPIPSWLRDRLVLLQSDTDKGVYTNETKRIEK